jgi:predicted SAM-dependent methyltransferase
MNLVTHLRRSVFDKFVDVKRSSGLEFGPHSQPMVFKTEGNVKYADYFTRDQHLKTPVPESENIPETDFLLGPGSYRDYIHGTFDYVIANHVLEHAPNMVQFLRTLAEMTYPDGVIFLAIPDKKYTFDKYRQNTTLAHVLADFYSDQKTASPEHMLEIAVFYDWEFVGKPMIAKDLLVKERMEAAYKEQPHYGIHCHVFQSETIIPTLFEPLCAMGLVPVSVAGFREARAEWGGEMLLVLRNRHSQQQIEATDFYNVKFCTFCAVGD